MKSQSERQVADRSAHELQRQHARSSTARHRVRNTISLWVADDRRRRRELLSAAQCNALARYAGTV